MGFSGAGAVRAMKGGDYQATIFAGTAAGIQSALDYAKAGSVTGMGGKVVLGPGTFVITAPLSIGANTELIGSGRYTTVIQADPTFSGAAMVVNADTTGGMQWCSIEDLMLDGNSDNGAVVALGIYFKGIGQPGRIRDITVNKCSGIGIKLEGISTNAGNFLVTNTGVSNCPLGSFVVTGYTGGYTFRDVNCEFVNAGVAAFLIDGPTVSFYPASILIDGIHIEGLLSGSAGIYISSSRNVHVKDYIYFGSGSLGDLVKIAGSTSLVNNVIIENVTTSANAVNNIINDTTHNYVLAAGSAEVNLQRYDAGVTTHHSAVVFKRAADQASGTSITAGDGTIIHLTGGTTLGAITTAATEMGKIIVVWFAATTTVNDGSSGGGNIFLSGSQPVTFLADDSLTLYSTGTNWIELARSTPTYAVGTPITAAATIAIPSEGDVFHVTGNTNITNGITVNARDAGRRVVLIFEGTPTVSDTGTSKLAGNFVAAGTTNDYDTLTLACDGTNWYEVARSAN